MNSTNAPPRRWRSGRHRQRTCLRAATCALVAAGLAWVRMAALRWSPTCAPRLPPPRRSRGHLIADYLSGSLGATAYADALAGAAHAFPPFNFLLCDADRCEHLSNHPLLARQLAAGIHGMSNGPLDALWPKTAALTEVLRHWCAHGNEDLQPLWAALGNPAIAPDAALPQTGVDLPIERLPWPHSSPDPATAPAPAPSWRWTIEGRALSMNAVSAQMGSARARPGWRSRERVDTPETRASRAHKPGASA